MKRKENGGVVTINTNPNASYSRVCIERDIVQPHSCVVRDNKTSQNRSYQIIASSITRNQTRFVGDVKMEEDTGIITGRTVGVIALTVGAGVGLATFAKFHFGPI